VILYKKNVRDNMSKIDITVSQDMTINTGNYSSIKPSIAITIKDVDGKNVSSMYDKIAGTLDSLMMLEILALSDEMESVQEMGYKKYKEMLANSLDAQGGVDRAIERINEDFHTV